MRGAVILAGGKGSRIGGNKHLRILHGKPLIRYMVDAASVVADEIIVVLRDDDSRSYQEVLPENVKLVLDTQTSEAPLVGMIAGARAARSEYSAFLSCDLAFLNPRVLDYLFSEAEGADAAIPQWPDGLKEPLHSVYKIGPTAAAAEAALKAKEYRNIAVAQRLNRVKYVAVNKIKHHDPELLTFFNVNTETDLATAEKIITHA